MNVSTRSHKITTHLPSVIYHPDVQALLALAALTFIFVLPAALMQGVYFYGDANDYFARLAYSAERLRAGQFALWNPYLSLGGSHIADPAALATYLPALALFLILPEAAAYNYTVILHLYLAASGMYLLARAWQLSRGASLLAAITFAFGGFLVAHLQHLNIVIGAAWLPWIFWCIEKFFNTRRISWLMGGSLVLALQIMGGHTQTVLYGGAAWAAYCVVRLARVARQRRAVWRELGALAWMCACAFGLAAIFLVPFAELLNFVTRSEHITYVVATSFSLEPTRLAQFVYPFFFGGNPGSVERGAGSLIEMTAYVGIVPLLLAVRALWRREWRVYFLIALGASALVLALGKYTPLYALVYQLPLFGAVRAPARFLELVLFALALLAGFGLDGLRKSFTARQRVFIFAALVIFLLLESGLLLAPRAGVKLSETLAGAAINPALDAAMFFTLAAIALFGMWSKKLFSERARVGLTLALVIADLFFVGWNFRYNFVAPFEVYAAPGQNANAIARERNSFATFFWGLGAVKPVSYLQSGDLKKYTALARAGLLQSLPMRFHIRSMQGYGSEPPAYSELRARIEKSGRWDENAARWLGAYGAQNLLSPADLALPITQFLQQERTVGYYRLNQGVGRVHFVTRAIGVTSPNDALRVLDENALNANFAVLETRAPQQFEQGSGAYEIVQDDAEQVSMVVQLDKPAYLILNDTYYPGWRARIDGQAAEILRANALVRAVAVPAGAHRVEFAYEPQSVKIGAFVSLLTLCLVTGILFWDVRRARRPIEK